MFKTLYFKLAAVMVGLFCLIGIFLTVLGLYATRLYSQEVNQMFNRNLAPHLLSERILLQGGHLNEPVIKHIFHQLMVVNPGIEVYLLDLKGKILAFSAPPGRVKKQIISLGPLKAFLNKTASFPILGDDPRDPEHMKVFSVAPVPLNGPLEGYLYVIVGGEDYDSVAQLLQHSYILRLSMLASVGVFLFALITLLLLFNRMTRPLRQLTAAMESFRECGFTESPVFLNRFRSDAGNEIDRLGTIFMQMADRIVFQIQELRQVDTLRREFVANITHDLRTPLTSLRGYLETLLLKSGKMEPADEKAYLTIALKRSDQLERLVSDLFELSKLDSNDVQVCAESFSLVELIDDIMQKFRLVADEKKIKLQANFVEHVPMVFADVGLIERVFDNLIGNAVRFTPHNGSIVINVIPNEERLTVRVSDTGSGIQPENIRNLFDRSYQLERGRLKNMEGSGLGLAITKRILELHGSGIEVESEVDAGTAFTFTLPVYSEGLGSPIKRLLSTAQTSSLLEKRFFWPC